MKLKTIKTYTKGPKKLEIKRIRTILENIIFDKLGLKNETEKKNFYKRAKIKN